MTKKAKVKILSQRVTERVMVIEADVMINRINKKKTFSVDKALSKFEIQQEIARLIKADSFNVDILEDFEVEI